VVDGISPMSAAARFSSARSDSLRSIRQRPVHRSTIRTPDNTRESSTSLDRPSQVPLERHRVPLSKVWSSLMRSSRAVGRWLSLFEDCSVAAVSVSVLDFFSLSLLSAPDARASSSFAWSCLGFHHRGTRLHLRRTAPPQALTSPHGTAAVPPIFLAVYQGLSAHH